MTLRSTNGWITIKSRRGELSGTREQRDLVMGHLSEPQRLKMQTADRARAIAVETSEGYIDGRIIFFDANGRETSETIRAKVKP